MFLVGKVLKKKLLYVECSSTYETSYVGCSGGTGGSVGGGSSSSSNPFGENPCEESTTENCNFDDEEDIDSPAPGYLPTTENDFIVRTTKPCATSVVRGFLNSSNSFEDVIGDVLNMFGNKPNFNIKITNGNLSPEFNGIFTPEHFAYNPPTTLAAFEGTVTLNNSITGCSQDLIKATLIHEIIHGYLEAQSKVLSEEEFLDRFPLWYTSNAQVSSKKLRDHNIIAERYVNKIKTMLQRMNPDLSSTAASALAWEGLQFTFAYKMQVQDNDITRGLYNNALKAAHCQYGGKVNDSRYNLDPC